MSQMPTQRSHFRSGLRWKGGPGVRALVAVLLLLAGAACSSQRHIDQLPSPVRIPSLSSPAVSQGGDAAPAADALDPLDALEPRVYNDAVFSGLGTWLDIFEQGYRHPVHTVERAQELGVTTLYVQTSNFTRPAIRFPSRYGAFIDAAHAHGIAVVAWYLPGLRNLPGDLHKSLAAIRYVSPGGDQADGFGLDIEAAEVRSHRARSTRLLLLSRQIRNTAGPSYPLGAITPMPLRIDGRISYWHDFPYDGIAQIYDAILPMNYFTYEVSGGPAVYRYTVKGTESIREGTGVPDFPVHQIGGISGAMTPEEASGFIQAVQADGCIGASLYNYSLMTPALWARMRPVASPRG